MIITPAVRKIFIPEQAAQADAESEAEVEVEVEAQEVSKDAKDKRILVVSQ